MVLYRIASKDHARDLSGTGAMLFGGRWNNKGTPLIYCSETLSLATLEIIANLSSHKLDRTLYCVELNFPQHLSIDTLKKLPKDWNAYPYTGRTAQLGTDFVQKNGFCLKVPSAIISSEYNFLINPHHSKMAEITIIDVRPFILDRRIFEQVSK